MDFDRIRDFFFTFCLLASPKRVSKTGPYPAFVTKAYTYIYRLVLSCYSIEVLFLLTLTKRNDFLCGGPMHYFQQHLRH